MFCWVSSFITIGALLDLSKFPSHWHWVLLLLATLVAAKTLIIMVLTKLVSGVTRTKAFRTGLILAQGGEFGLWSSPLLLIMD